MKLLIFIIRLLAAVAISGQWVIPADSLGKELKINHPPEIEHDISAIDKKSRNEKSDQEVLPYDGISSKVIPRSAIDTKELVKIFNIAYTSNESQPLNHYELPDEESVKRDFRHVKLVNVDAESQQKGFSSSPFVSHDTQDEREDKIIFSVCANVGKPLHANGNYFNDLVSEVDEVSDAMVNTVKLFAKSLKNKFETLCSKGLGFVNIDHVAMIIGFIMCFLGLCLLFYLFNNILLNLRNNFDSLDCEEGNNSYTMRKLSLGMGLENDNTIAQNEVDDKGDDFNTVNKKDDVVACVYPPLGDSINEVLEEAQKK